LTAPQNAPPAGDTVVLIHGLRMMPRSWQQWVERFETQGRPAIAPSWPGVEGDISPPAVRAAARTGAAKVAA
jgi:hypothetical protein